MHNLVYNVFKTIMVAIILIFVFDMTAYLYRAFSLNQRVESMMTSLQKVVMENNCLPEDEADLYQQLLCQMAANFNAGSGDVFNPNDPTNFFQNNDDAFILALDWNYKDDAVNISGFNPVGTRYVYNNNGNWVPQQVNLLSKCMGDVAEYGDVQCIQIRVLVAQPTWGFMKSNHTADDFRLQDSDNVKLDSRLGKTHVFTYTYFVPCLKYQAYSQ